MSQHPVHKNSQMHKASTDQQVSGRCQQLYLDKKNQTADDHNNTASQLEPLALSNTYRILHTYCQAHTEYLSRFFFFNYNGIQSQSQQETQEMLKKCQKCTYLFERVTARGRERERIFLPLVHFPRGPRWPKLNQGNNEETGTLSRSPICVQRPTHLSYLPLLFSGHQQRVGWQGEQPGHEPVSILDAGIRGSSFMH